MLASGVFCREAMPPARTELSAVTCPETGHRARQPRTGKPCVLLFPAWFSYIIVVDNMERTYNFVGFGCGVTCELACRFTGFPFLIDAAQRPGSFCHESNVSGLFMQHTRQLGNTLAMKRRFLPCFCGPGAHCAHAFGGDTISLFCLGNMHGEG